MSEFIPGVTSQYFGREPIISFNQSQLEDIEKIYRGPQYPDLKMAPSMERPTQEELEKITKGLAEFYEWYESGDALDSHEDSQSKSNTVYATAVAGILELAHENGSSPLHVLSIAVHRYLGGLGKCDNRIRVISDVLRQISGVAAKIDGVENWP
ncbi:hypothetical protein O9X98_09780 [Agrobacterium salinitolerans]|nr:hypothetical protein [Agrobacterium salinitolerans]